MPVTLEVITEVQIISETSKWMCGTAREKGVDEKLIRLVVHEDICSYSSYKVSMEQFLSKVMQRKCV